MYVHLGLLVNRQLVCLLSHHLQLLWVKQLLERLLHDPDVPDDIDHIGLLLQDPHSLEVRLLSIAQKLDSTAGEVLKQTGLDLTAEAHRQLFPLFESLLLTLLGHVQDNKHQFGSHVGSNKIPALDSSHSMGHCKAAS